MKQEITIEQLTALADFPDYYIDTRTGEVYSHKAFGGWCKKVILRRLGGRLMGRNERNQQRCYALKDKSGRLRYVSQGRLMISVTYGCSYFQIPKDINCNYNPKKGITMRNHSEAASVGWKEKLEADNRQRLAMLDAQIKSATLMKQALLGDREPLLAYVKEQRNIYIYRIRQKTKWSRRRASEAYEMALDRLLDLTKGKINGLIVTLDFWMVKTAIGSMRAEMSRASREVSYTKRTVPFV